jgi:hypothetical protein
MAIGLTGNIVPFGAFYILEDIYLQGGYQTVADNTERDAIPAGSRKAGMLVWSEGAGTLYQLGPGLTNGDWAVFGASAISSPTPGNDVSAVTANNGAGDAGDVLLEPGDSTAGAGGSILATGGDGTTAGGDITNTGGDASAGNGGSVTNQGGTGSVDGGDVNLIGGEGTTGDGGDINLTPGAGGTNQGVINISPPAGGTAPELRFFEDLPGTDYVGLKAPAVVTTTWTFTLPPAPPAANGYVLSSTIAGITTWVAPGGGSSSFRTSFTNASLVGGVLSVNHALAEQFNQVTVYNNLNLKVMPDSVEAVDANNADITLSSFQAANGGSIPGTWNVVITP